MDENENLRQSILDLNRLEWCACTFACVYLYVGRRVHEHAGSVFFTEGVGYLLLEESSRLVCELGLR